MKCWFCNSEMIWDSDFSSDEYWGESGDSKEDNRIVAVLHCPVCNAEAVFTQGMEEASE